jgi:CubicO group peptidase (beta-lactamase class C family)
MNPAWRAPIERILGQEGVPGAAVAVVARNAIVELEFFGAAGPHSSVSSETTFQVASISKAIAATVAVLAVQRGLLGLDDDLAAILAEAVPTLKVPARPFHLTLRRLLSHTGGFLLHGVGGFDPAGPVPTLDQLLAGENGEKSRYRVIYPPGLGFKYSGAGYAALEKVLAHRLSRPFPEIAADLLFAKLGMTSSTFVQDLSPDALARLAHGHDEGGQPLAEKRQLYPATAAAGLVSNAEDLAKFIIGINQSAAGQGVLDQERIREMLTPQLPPIHGLGFALRPTLAPCDEFAHNGSHLGFEAALAGSIRGASGHVILANRDTKLRFSQRVAAVLSGAAAANSK